jgi:maltose O-acetyltransferase
MLAGDLYLAEDPEIVRDRLRDSQLMGAYNRMDVDDEAGRQRILRQLLATVGHGVEIRPPFYCDLGHHVHIGARTFVNVGLIALDIARIVIGDDVQIGPNVQLLTPTHPIEPERRRAKLEAAKPVVIGDNVWLGGGAIVLPGATWRGIPPAMCFACRTDAALLRRPLAMTRRIVPQGRPDKDGKVQRVDE